MSLRIVSDPFSSLKALSEYAHDQAVRKGWWEQPGGAADERSIPTLLALIHSEVSEALESYRNSEPFLWLGEKGKPEGLAPELADVIIRIGDLAGRYGIDLDHAVNLKLQFNEGRSYRHGNKRC